MSMLRLTSDEYVENHGGCCPNCQSGEIEGGPFEVEGERCWQPVRCLVCGFNWNDLYRLSGYEETGP
jgi:predicted Zn-ribbon and HTH transcriptional regulator